MISMRTVVRALRRPLRVALFLGALLGGAILSPDLRGPSVAHADDDAPVKAEIIRKAFRGSEFLYTLRLQSGETVMAHVPSHHDHKIGEWIGIRAEEDHVVTFTRACPVNNRELCQMPCQHQPGASGRVIEIKPAPALADSA